MSILKDFQAIGKRLETKWVNEQFAESRRILSRYRIKIREAIEIGFAQKQFQRYQRPGVLDADSQRALALRIAGSHYFSRLVPGIFRVMVIDLAEAKNRAAENIYNQVSAEIADAYNRNTPDGVKFEPVTNRYELAELKKDRYEGVTYPEAIKFLARDVPARIRAQVNRVITESGTSAVAQRQLLDAYGAMFRSLEDKVELTHRQFMLSTYKIAERNMTRLVRL